jgi:hypothetical protein
VSNPRIQDLNPSGSNTLCRLSESSASDCSLTWDEPSAQKIFHATLAQLPRGKPAGGSGQFHDGIWNRNPCNITTGLRLPSDSPRYFSVFILTPHLTVCAESLASSLSRTRAYKTPSGSTTHSVRRVRASFTSACSLPCDKAMAKRRFHRYSDPIAPGQACRSKRSISRWNMDRNRCYRTTDITTELTVHLLINRGFSLFLFFASHLTQPRSALQLG